MSDKIICGDCCEILKNFYACNLQFDLIVADPPFNKGKDYGELVDDSRDLDDYYKWCEEWIKLGFSVLTETGSFFLYCPSQHLGKFQVEMSKYGIWQNTIVWAYVNPTPDKKRFPKSWSAFLFFTKSTKFYFNPEARKVRGFQTNMFSKVKNTRLTDLWIDVSKLVGGFLAQKEVIRKPGTYKREFVYQLPEELLERMVLSVTKSGDLVLDLFAHSGTTSVVAKRFDRNYVAVEINPDYCGLIKKRLSAVQKGIFSDV